MMSDWPLGIFNLRHDAPSLDALAFKNNTQETTAN
jgi:hypothetical protein